MAIQYPKHEHITLGSVEGWGTNNNILRDPPKSIHTRRIDKVGQTSDITDTIDSSNDRASEAINLYARGVNPMVSVSYSNYGANGGRVGELTRTSGRTQAFLPYTIMDGGAFRPPVRGPRELLPLSRLPRSMITDITSGVDAPDYSKTSQYLGELRAIKELLNAYNVSPNKSGSIQKGLVENFKMNDTINDKHINVDVTSGTRSRDISNFTRENTDVYKGVNDEMLYAYANANIGRETTHTLEGFEIDENRYIQDSLSHEVNTNRSRNNPQGLDNINVDTVKYIQDGQVIETFTNHSSDISVKSLEEMYDNGRVTVKDMMQYERSSGIKPNHTFLNDIAQHNPLLEMRNPQFEVTSQKSDSTVYKRIDHENELKYNRNRPMPSVKANITKIEDFNSISLSSRDVRLNPTLQKGGFNNNGSKPTSERAQLIPRSRESDKDKIRNQINQQQFNRFDY
jgi:hypothetical protein